jgi:monoamine oxidase
MKKLIRRRDFLAQTGLSIASLPLFSTNIFSASQESLKQTGKPKKVIIIGAGLAGLTAAYELKRVGHEVIILEARLRPGGRIYTLRAPFSDGMYAEAGASRIPDNHHWTLKYVKRFGLALEPFYPNKMKKVAYIRGKRVKIEPGKDIPLSQLPLSLTLQEQQLGISGIWERYVTPAVNELGNPTQQGWPSAKLNQYDQVTFAEFLRQQGLTEDAIALLESPYYKPEDDQISALWWLREAALLKDQRHEYKIKGGNDLLPKAFAAQLAEHVRYGAAVVRIEQNEHGIGVVYQQAGTQQKLTGDYLICAIPFTTLKRIDVSPAFSTEKQKAIEQHSYDSVTRVFLQVRERPWEGEGLSGFATTDLPEDIWHPTFGHPGKRGILVSYMSGRQARQIATLQEQKRIGYMIQHMDEVFPGVSANVEGGKSYCWDEDEWALGAYSILKPGQMQTLLPYIAGSEGRIHFAGEHTSAWPGWMQGAIESGNRVAREINKSP